MSRPLRLEFAGAVYSVVSRGQERSKIFRDDADREAFLQVLESVARDHGWKIHAYCLMASHYHLLIETPSPNLSLGMRALNGRYTQKYNRLHSIPLQNARGITRAAKVRHRLYPGIERQRMLKTRATLPEEIRLALEIHRSVLRHEQVGRQRGRGH